MPSSTLQQISEQIESNGTDHFSKFYMYAGLLNLVAVRAPNANFFTVQPQTSPFFGSAKRLNIGEFDGDFATLVNNYQNTFATPTADPIMALQKVVMAYARKGQLADLVFIVDQMLGHLNVSQLEPTDKHNKGIYGDVNFKRNSPGTFQLNSKKA